MNKKYCEKYDSYFDSDGKWLEKECPDEKCSFCGKRPKKHSPHKWVFADKIGGICK